MTRGRVWGLIGVALLTAACGTTPSATVTNDLKDVAGTWSGWTKTASGADLRVNLLVQVDGQYRMIIERSYVYDGRVIRAPDGLRFRHGAGSLAGTVTLLAEPRIEYLRFVADTGALWIQFERPR
jgi:hypothetical protein